MTNPTPTVRVALVGDRGLGGVKAALQALYPKVEFTTPAEADVTGCNLFGAGPLETGTAVRERIAAAAAQLENLRGPLVAVCDNPETTALAEQHSGQTIRYATTYGAAAEWHLAITTATMQRVSFVLQGPENNYLRGAVQSVAKYHAQNLGLALIMLHSCGIDVAKLLAQHPKSGVVLRPTDSYQAQTIPVTAPYQGSDLTWIFDSSETAFAVDALLGEVTDAACAQVWAVTAPASALTPAAQQQEMLRGAYFSHSCDRVLMVSPDATTQPADRIQAQHPLHTGITRAQGRATVVNVPTLTAALTEIMSQAPAATTVVVSGSLAHAAAEMVTGA